MVLYKVVRRHKSTQYSVDYSLTYENAKIIAELWTKGSKEEGIKDYFFVARLETNDNPYKNRIQFNG
jgi:hypothetical protein